MANKVETFDLSSCTVGVAISSTGASFEIYQSGNCIAKTHFSGKGDTQLVNDAATWLAELGFNLIEDVKLFKRKVKALLKD